MNTDSQHKCSVCTRSFKSSNALLQHRRDSHTTKTAAKNAPVGAKQARDPLHVGRSRAAPTMGKRRGNNFPGALAASSGGVQLPELTHALSIEDRLFIDNYLNPCDERMGPSSGSKIPDGSLPNSGINGFREVINVAPPFTVPSGPSALGGPLWSLIIMKLPTIREAIYLIATNSRDDLSLEDQTKVANIYNTGGVKLFPEWVNVVDDGSLKMSKVVWSQLRATTNLRFLFKQVRISKSGFTTFHNAPDLYNQGMIIAGQWNLDNSPRGLSAVTSPEPLTSNNLLPVTWTVNSANHLNGGSVTTLTRVLPLMPPSVIDALSPLSTAAISVADLGVVGKVRIRSSSTLISSYIPLEYGGSFYVEITTTGAHLFVHINALDSSGAMHSESLQTTNIAAGSVNLEWAVLAVRSTVAGTDIELPPLDTQSIVQSTPKSIVLPMKQFNGAYTVLRAWEPVFSLQEADNLGPILWSRKGAYTPSGSGDRDEDLVDLNFGTAVQAIMGISLAASVTIKIIQDIEFVAGEDSPWQGFMNPNVSVDPQVISLARAISLDQPFAFPQTYNSMGTLLDGVETLLSHIPIIGNAVPLVSKVVRSLFPSTASNAPHPELRQGDVSQLVAQLLRALGLVKE